MHEQTDKLMYITTYWGCFRSQKKQLNFFYLLPHHFSFMKFWKLDKRMNGNQLIVSELYFFVILTFQISATLPSPQHNA